MARLLPFRSEPSTEKGQPRVVDLEGEDADAVFGALSSTTARRIYAQLDDEPGTPSDIADAIDSSIQNVRYHLEKLEDAGLIEIVDTWYSSRGNEMSVYATTDGPLIVTSDESMATQLRTALSRLIGGIGALAGGSLLVQHGLTRWFAPAEESGGQAPAHTEDAGDTESGTDGANGGDATDAHSDAEADETSGGESSADAEADAEGTANEQATPREHGSSSDSSDSVGNGTDGMDGTDGIETVGDGGVEAAEAVFASIPPGLLFFLGGLVVLLAVTIYWYWYRPVY